MFLYGGKHNKGAKIGNEIGGFIMGRTSRKDMENSSFFHIMVQGINKECIFNTQKNKEEYLKLLYKNNKGVDIIAYCLMDNHVHILAQIDEIQDMQVWMRKTNTSYAIFYNKNYDRVGYVFRDRYKTQVIKNEKHLCLAIEYIHNNPIKAGICKNKQEYSYSSYNTIYKGRQTEVQSKIIEVTQKSVLQNNSSEEDEKKFELVEENKQDKEEICKEVLQEFLQNNKINTEVLKKKRQNLVQIVSILKFEYGISYRIMEKSLGISREKLRRLIS